MGLSPNNDCGLVQRGEDSGGHSIQRQRALGYSERRKMSKTNSEKRNTRMKKYLLIILAMLLAVTLVACTENKNESSSSRSNSTSSSYYSSSSSESGLSNSQIESIVASALVKQIDKQFKTAEGSQCRYKISTIEENKTGTHYYVYGTVYLYDKYGSLTTGYVDGSGSFSKTFEVGIVKSSGNISKCEIGA